VTEADHFPATVRIDGGDVLIRLPLARAHDLRVALAECPCRAAKSSATMGIRQSLSKALGRLPMVRS
jgi:hypothetical protein